MTDSRELTTLDDDGYGVPSMVPRGGHVDVHDDDGEHYELPASVDRGREYDPSSGSSDDPRLAKYSPPAALAQQMAPADWAIWDHVRPAAHKAGVTNAQLGALAKAVLGLQMDQVERANDKAVAVLQRRFGKDFRQAMLDADAAAAEYGDSGLSAWLDTPVPGFPGLRFATIPHIAVLLASVGRAMRGGSTAYEPLARNTETSGGQSMSQQKALAEAKALQEKYPLSIAQRPRAIDQRIQALFAIAYPDDEEDLSRNGAGPLNHMKRG